MKRQPRLSQSEVVERLRAHAARFGAVSRASVAEHDRIVMRSVRLHFASFDAAREAAGVPAAPRRRRAGRQVSRKRVWSRSAVRRELRGRQRAGESTGWAELMEDGRAGLIGAAAVYGDGLARARADARVAAPARRMPVPRWTAESISGAIRERARAGETLASSKAPQRFVAAARWHFGSWDAALAAAGVDRDATRLQRRPYTRDGILAVLRRMAHEGKALRAGTLREEVKLDTVRKLFGSVARAVLAAGLPLPGEHANQKWDRARVIDELRARAARGEVAMSRGLEGAAQQYFGSAHAARAAAGLPPLVREAWTRASLIEELQRRARSGESDRRLGSACTRLFGSLEAARDAAGVPARRLTGMSGWQPEALLDELRRRTASGEQLGRGLTEGLRRAFGSLVAARALAGVPTQRELARAGDDARVGAGWRRWSRAQVTAKLQAWAATGSEAMRAPLAMACVLHFGSLARAVAETGLAASAEAWTPDRIRRALSTADPAPRDPGLIAACIDRFGSMAAARSAANGVRRAWTRATVIAELQARARRGLAGVGQLMREPAMRLFGSAEAALRAAAESTPHAAAENAPRAAAESAPRTAAQSARGAAAESASRAAAETTSGAAAESAPGAAAESAPGAAAESAQLL